MSHRPWLNTFLDPQQNPPSANVSLRDQNENVQPSMSKPSEENLQLLVSMMKFPPPQLPPPPSTSLNIADNKRKRKGYETAWFNSDMFDNINSIDSMEVHIRNLEEMDQIDPVFKENLLMAFNFFTGEVGRHKRAHVDQVTTSLKKLQSKDSTIHVLNETNVQLRQNLDEASRQIGTEKANFDIANERNKLYEAQNDSHVQRIQVLEENLRGRDRDNNFLVQEIHKVKQEKLIEHAENAAENRRKCEKLALMMKHVSDIPIVEKKQKKSKKPKVADDQPSTT